MPFFVCGRSAPQVHDPELPSSPIAPNHDGDSPAQGLRAGEPGDPDAALRSLPEWRGFLGMLAAWRREFPMCERERGGRLVASARMRDCAIRQALHGERELTLDLSNQSLTELPPGLTRLALKHLNAAGNCFTDIDASVERMPELESLDLSRNQLCVLPESVHVLFPCLRVLNVSGNRLERLPDSLSEMRLERLYANDNDLIFLPYELGKTGTLRYLLLMGNRLKGQTMPPLLHPQSRVFRALDKDIVLHGNRECPFPLRPPRRGAFPPPAVPAFHAGTVPVYLGPSQRSYLDKVLPPPDVRALLGDAAGREIAHANDFRNWAEYACQQGIGEKFLYAFVKDLRTGSAELRKRCFAIAHQALLPGGPSLIRSWEVMNEELRLDRQERASLAQETPRPTIRAPHAAWQHLRDGSTKIRPA
ncbi:leucine-rich repeat domain-containing protein [Noviherbaspirillum galbum]|uniref:Leucine-rich repeat domain-containing protein n=1 Tax=Noviherbaspirillum galbum TaxID=2709383 RepID=A0A6B3SMJ8_9BURK|nr:leucine-rich repeat domain-containing protein [Noviherbaspirillum galbum]NEX62001.1 leucine-rich repeat domain-containing protein [Noviherbaspirillum galbum]